jgi:hypothetical protein
MSEGSSIENAWHIHAQIVDWTGKVDAKAAFAMTVELALFAGLISLTSEDKLLGTFRGPVVLVLFLMAAGLLIAGIVCSALVVVPMLNSKDARHMWDQHIIYFGHLRHWNEIDLVEKLKTADIMPMLARQLVIMSKYAWIKHLRLQWSIGLGLASGLLTIITLLLNV